MGGAAGSDSWPHTQAIYSFGKQYGCAARGEYVECKQTSQYEERAKPESYVSFEYTSSCWIGFYLVETIPYGV